MIQIHLLFLLFGLILLVKGSDFFVESASRIAKRFGVSEFLIGFTLVALGTSIPELSTAIGAAIKNNSGLIIGNIVGSNIANLGLVLGLGAIISTLYVRKTIFKRDGYLMFSAAILFYLLAFDNKISGAEGILFLSVYFAYNTFIISSEKTKKVYDLSDFLDYYLKFKYITTIRSRFVSREIKSRFSKRKRKQENRYRAKKEYQAFKESLIKDFLVFILAAIAIVYGTRHLIYESLWIAESLGFSTTLIGITVIALGTSIPELSVTIRAAKKGYSEMAVGNILGSNITNILLILGITSLITPLEVSKNILSLGAPFMLILSLTTIYIMRTKWKIERREGLILLALYTIFLTLLFIL